MECARLSGSTEAIAALNACAATCPPKRWGRSSPGNAGAWKRSRSSSLISRSCIRSSVSVTSSASSRSPDIPPSSQSCHDDPRPPLSLADLVDEPPREGGGGVEPGTSEREPGGAVPADPARKAGRAAGPRDQPHGDLREADPGSGRGLHMPGQGRDLD